MLIPYDKPFLTIDQQYDLLRSRGMQFESEDHAKTCLARIGYYRLSAYWYPFRKNKLEQGTNGKLAIVYEDAFIDGTSFSQIVELYVFDKRLRLLMLDAIERIEVYVRITLADKLGAVDRWGHLKGDELHGNFTKKRSADKSDPNGAPRTDHVRWLEKLNKALSQAKGPVIDNFTGKYNSPFPIWISIEFWDFGLMSTLYAGLNHADGTSLAQQFGAEDFKMMTSWLRAINHVRNICAHHSRLWNKGLVDYPSLPQSKGAILPLDHLVKNDIGQRHVYATCAVMRHLLTKSNPSTTWGRRLVDLMSTFPASGKAATLHTMGFPEDWLEASLWSDDAKTD